MKRWESAKETGKAVSSGASQAVRVTEIELEFGPESVICGRKDRERCPQGHATESLCFCVGLSVDWSGRVRVIVY